MAEMTELDTLVRRMLLAYPMLFATRWDVLRHLYLVIGNGYHWADGRLVSASDRDETEEALRGAFFRDLDEFDQEMCYRSARPDAAAEQALRRARRAFQLDHLDEIVHEGQHDAFPGALRGALTAGLASPAYSLAFTVPDGAEESFRRGAEEALRGLLPILLQLVELGAPMGDLRSATVNQIRKLRDQKS